MAHRTDILPPAGRRLARAAAALSLSVLALTACGGDDSSDDGAAATTSAAEETSSSAAATTSADGGAPAQAQRITATEADFSITLDSDQLTPGDYTIEVVNDGGASHDLVVERDGEDVAESEMIAPGESGTVEVTLEPGEYVFYCSVGNHRAMGMEITVEVT